MSTEFDEFVGCITARLNEAEQCQTCVDTRIISNALRNLEAAVDAIRLFIVDCESLYQTDIPQHICKIYLQPLKDWNVTQPIHGSH